MPKRNSKTRSTKASASTSSSKLPKSSKKSRKLPIFLQKIGSFFSGLYKKYKKNSAARIRLHRSFRRSYREDYIRDLEVPGPLYHAMDTLRHLVKNWRLFLPLILLAVIFNVALVGIMSEETYVKFQDALAEENTKYASGELGNFAKSGLILVSTITTGGLSSGMSEVEIVFSVLGFLIIWLVTVFLLRHILAGRPIKLRDALYNALAPLISTFLVLCVALVQALPFIIVIITYATALQTDFLSTPFYALVYFIFAASFTLLSAYLLSGTAIALVAVTAQGTYPVAALRTASDLIAGRRTHFLSRLLFLLVFLAIIWTVIMMPLITLDLFFKAHFEWCEGWPFVSVCLLVMTCASFVYVSAYIYLYYRRLLAYRETRRPGPEIEPKKPSRISKFLKKLKKSKNSSTPAEKSPKSPKKSKQRV